MDAAAARFQLGSNDAPPIKVDRTQLAVARTWLAHERTLMAWVRTATAMIGFGFTIYKFFQVEGGQPFPRRGLLTARDFALIMIGIGNMALLLATVAHRREIRPLRTHLGHRFSLAELVAALVWVFGTLVMLAAAFRS
jgi:putative membrane protein